MLLMHLKLGHSAHSSLSRCSTTIASGGTDVVNALQLVGHSSLPTVSRGTTTTPSRGTGAINAPPLHDHSSLSCSGTSKVHMNESQPPHVFVPSPSHSHAITLAVTRSKKRGQTLPPPPPTQIHYTPASLALKWLLPRQTPISIN